MLRFHCPHCGKRLKMPPEWAGQSGRCPKCLSAIIIPNDRKVSETPESPCLPDDVKEEILESDTDDSAPPTRRRKHWRIHPVGVSLVGAFSFLLLIVLVGVAWKHNRNAEARAKPQQSHSHLLNQRISLTIDPIRKRHPTELRKTGAILNTQAQKLLLRLTTPLPIRNQKVKIGLSSLERCFLRPL